MARRVVRARAARGTIQGAVTGVVPVTEQVVPPVGLRPIRPGDQSYPTRNSLPSMHEQARQDLESRKRLGVSRYGVALQPANGRNAARDLYEEVLDASAYGAQVVWEQDHPEETYVGRLATALYRRSGEVNFTGVFVPTAVTDLLTSFGIQWFKEELA